VLENLVVFLSVLVALPEDTLLLRLSFASSIAVPRQFTRTTCSALHDDGNTLA
jgi:hypothetical protein